MDRRTAGPEHETDNGHYTGYTAPVAHEPLAKPPDAGGGHPSTGGHPAGTDGSHSHMPEDYRSRFIVSMILTVPILALSVPVVLRISLTFPGSGIL